MQNVKRAQAIVESLRNRLRVLSGSNLARTVPRFHGLRRPEGMPGHSELGEGGSGNSRLHPRTEAWLSEWGTSLRTCISQSLLAAWRAEDMLSCSGLSGPTRLPSLDVGTDFSGAEAPIFALRGLRMPFQHIFSSDKAAAPKKFIQANARPQLFFDNVLTRNPVEVPKVHLYVAGFPCKPFSTLHTGTALLQEREAKAFKATVRHLKKSQPVCFVLENVMGIRRCIAKVLRSLRSTGYYVFEVPMNPRDLGEPVQRPRIYFLGVRCDVSVAKEEKLAVVARRAWSGVVLARAGSGVQPLAWRVLPTEHPAVRRCQEHRRARMGSVKGARPAAKWPDRHTAYLRGLGTAGAKSTHMSLPTATAMLISGRREADIWNTHVQYHAAQNLAVDLSQSLGRNGQRCDGAVPTVTPGSDIASAALGRRLVPLEKLLIHGFPVRELALQDLSDSEVASLGGNTMHVHIVAAAIFLVTSLVDWRLPAALLKTPAGMQKTSASQRKRRADSSSTRGQARSSLSLPSTSRMPRNTRQTAKCKPRVKAKPVAKTSAEKASALRSRWL